MENVYNPNFNFENGLVNYQNYGMFINIIKGEPIYINTDNINANTWNDYFSPLHNILLDGIETDLIQNYKINVSFGNVITVRLAPVDLWINLIMWRLLIYTNQRILPKHLVFSKHITQHTIK